MKQYLDLVERVLSTGEIKSDRTGVGTQSVFGHQMRFDLNEGFPLLGLKRTAWKPLVAELLWFLEGSTDERRLAELQYGKDREELIGKNTVWTANADYQGKNLGYENTDYIKELGPIYSKQWRNSGGVDQIKEAMNAIRFNPDSRRIIVNSWNVAEIDQMALPPCHTMFQFYVSNSKKLSCHLYQRSGDIGLGIPFNIASYSLLTHMIAKSCDIGVGDFIHTIGDAHIYSDHIEGLQEIFNREDVGLPELIIDDYVIEDFEHVIERNSEFSLNTMNGIRVDNYNPHPTIKLNMAV